MTCNGLVSKYKNSYFASPRGVEQKELHWDSGISNSFLLFYSPQPRIQVWILKLSNSGYVTLP